MAMRGAPVGPPGVSALSSFFSCLLPPACAAAKGPLSADCFAHIRSFQAKKPAAPAGPPSSQALALLNKQFQERDDKKAQVFQPGWTQPWQTIEEFGEEEYRRMKAA
jgi:hypothetical protein